jgi:hypothetical protein
MDEKNAYPPTITVTATEMQVRFNEMLSARPPRVARVTHRSIPVVAVIPLGMYQVPCAGENDREGEDAPIIDRVAMPITQVRGLFYSYSQRLAPLLDAGDNRVKVIEVMRRSKCVGIVMAWKYWDRYRVEYAVPDSSLLSPVSPAESNTFTIAAARHRLYIFAEQFAREAKEGVHRPVVVINDEQPVFAIVPWAWYQMVTAFVKSQSPTPFRVTGEGMSCDLNTPPNLATTEEEVFSGE